MPAHAYTGGHEKKNGKHTLKISNNMCSYTLVQAFVATHRYIFQFVIIKINGSG